jgi:cellobiose phosphorylase
MNIYQILILILIAAIFAAIIIWMTRKSTIEFQIEDVALTADELERHAESLAKSQVTAKKKYRVKKVVDRLELKFKDILSTYTKFSQDISESFLVPPAAEWLLDNFYIMEEQRSIIAAELRNISQSLPIITEGIYSGFPRVYVLSVEIVSHIDGNANEKTISDFIAAYQRHEFLSIEELWLLPLMVKAALLEKLWVVCEKLNTTRQDWHKAEQMVGIALKNNEDCEVFKKHINELEELTPAFVEFLIRKLRKKGSKTLWMIDCLDSILAQKSTTTDSFISTDHYNQAVMQVSMANIVNSMRVLSGFNAAMLFERLSEVERILREDPCNVYSSMDSNSRNKYRNIIVKMADRYKTTEINIARTCYELAKEAIERDNLQLPYSHVGYYLIGEGRKALSEKLGKDSSDHIQYTESAKKFQVKLYIWTIIILSLVITCIPLFYSILKVRSNPVFTVLAGIIGIIPASEIVISVINSCINRFVQTSAFPKLELKQGIPEELSTMVIVPTLIPNIKRTIALIDNLEVFFLANKSGSIYFSLVGDFKDANEKLMPEDELIVKAALKRIDELNSKYAANGIPKFYFFSRGRQFNQKQNKWMGWERKRGAIIEFNRMLRGNRDTSYIYHSAEIEALPYIKYVITLDADTQLPLETARQLVGTIAHPLNKAVFNEAKGIVTQGYGLLQPRINVNIESANASAFTKVFAGQGGIDPYTTTVSDVYQDAFGEGIFTGKGIYEIDIFQKALDNVIPENTVLSHDLLEGSYLRTGLVTDIELIDGYPAKYSSFMMRLHRWTRGDWQLLHWIFGKNPLSALSIWKMVDNLRRSLLYPSMAVLLIFSLAALYGSASAWVCLALAALGSSIISYFVNIIFAGDYRIYVSKRSATVISGFEAIIVQIVLLIAFGPYQAFLMTDAIIRTLMRVIFTRKNMLEWVTAADMELALKNDVLSYYRKMWISPVFGAAVMALAYFHNSFIWLGTAAFLLWLWAPWIAFYISRPTGGRVIALSSDKLDELRLLARKTWCYFDEFAGSEENYLPADNFQVEPYKGAAHRTSPTNIGLLLVSNLAARDMGYISTIDLLERIEHTIDTIEKMEKWNGHLYNWYNTTNLRILSPKFVSTVDSGNFAGYLMVLIEGLKQYGTRPVYDSASNDAIFELLELCNAEIDKENPYFDLAAIKKLAGKEYEKSLEAIAADQQKAIAAEEQKADLPFKNLISAVSVALNELINKNKPGYWTGKLIHQVNVYHAVLDKYGEKIFGSLNEIQELNSKLQNIIGRVSVLLDNMHFIGLYDADRNLFSIGFDVESGQLNKSYYDLFASEARQTSLIAIANGEVSRQHWFKLGRKLVRADGRTGLASWTGTMFEYLMPRLLIKSYPDTLIEKTYKFVVNTQIKYGISKNIPWGISESCFYAFDIALNYQYKAFGAPHLGLKRGLVNDFVIAPYATVMAIDISPEECFNNIQWLKQFGAEGEFGLYEAIDFTEARLNDGHKCEIVKSYMVHHQGMSMLAFVNFFKDNIMQARFHMNPQIKAADGLLQERFPREVIISKEYIEQPSIKSRKQYNCEETVIRSYTKPSVIPEMHLLTNGSYNIALTEKGSGYGRCNSMAVYRWINDYMESSGVFIYLRNVNSNEFWSVTYNPTNTEPEAYKVVFSPHKAEYIRREGNIETNTEVMVSAEDNTELRRVTIHNHSSSNRIIELTSYMEAVLTQAEADEAHPAFSKLFVKTEYIDQYNGLLAVRRKRDDVRQTVWGYHVVSTNGKVQGRVEYETNRARFIGRNRSLASPKAMETDQPLSNSVGPVLDPVFSLRLRISIGAGESAVVNFCVGVCDTRKVAMDMLEKYSNTLASERVIEMAWTRSIVEAGFVDVCSDDERAYLKLLPKLLYGIDRSQQSEYIIKNNLGQADLWPLGISGDLPIVLVTIENRDSFEEIQWTLKMYDYYRLKGITFDLVILIINEEGYNQPIFDMIRDMAVSGRSHEHMDKKGGIFIRKAMQIDAAQKNLLYACAKIIINADDGVGDLIEDAKPIQVENRNVEDQSESIVNDKFENTRNDNKVDSELKSEKYGYNKCSMAAENGYIDKITQDLQFYNGIGGFSNDGNEYVICLKAGENTPAPWSNIIANEKFGFICTENGGGYTWHQNSSQNKLTTWINDPVQDTPSEIIYLHDINSGDIWTCTPSPVREEEPYVIRHGFGYTSFQHNSHGLEQELVQFAALDCSVKISILKIKNNTENQVSIDAAYYLKPVLGTEAGKTSPYIVTAFEPEPGTVFIENVYNPDFRGLKAYLSCSGENVSYTGQRLEFIGETMDPARPAGMRESLSGKTGAGFDSCAVIKTCISVGPGEITSVVFLFGQDEYKASKDCITKFTNIQNALSELDRVKESWNKRLKQIQVSTEDASMNILINGWLQYQVMSSRILARTGFYQAGGAFGFRDQLQDAMAVVYALPEMTKKQILLHCRHQFVEGDVQHWWHEQKTNGIRTRYSDDLLWLPYVTSDYISVTGDYDILNLQENYLQSESLKENEHERYEIPSLSDIKGTVYEHCMKAIDKGLRLGTHGIPLMGGGDWNDGMNLIGVQGRGESVWLGWFLYCVLQKMIPVCRHVGDSERADYLQNKAAEIIEALENEAWDGSWYRRAYFDDGEPLGSIQNDEGKIDSLSQSWAAICKAAKQSRVEEAMDAVEKYLIDRKNGLIKLLTPPFYDSNLNPGYIKGYLPGVRENGGQYTHAATWVVYAFTQLENGEKAWELFNMINPVNHARTNMECMTYKVEPYVMAADVYAVYPNEGRGGWTWYTGAAGWMYRIGIEHMLGLKKQGSALIISPCIPKKLSGYSVKYMYGNTLYNISVKNQNAKNVGVTEIKEEDKVLKTNKIEMVDDGREHFVEVFM